MADRPDRPDRAAGLYAVVTFNGLVRLRNQSEEAFSDIDVQLKRRHDLIPNLVETVKGYAAHERQMFENVTAARSTAVAAHGPEAQAQAENQLTGALRQLFAVAENYPDLKASQNFLELQNELTDTEDKIQASRRFYNMTVRDLNIKVQQFPSSVDRGLRERAASASSSSSRTRPSARSRRCSVRRRRRRRSARSRCTSRSRPTSGSRWRCCSASWSSTARSATLLSLWFGTAALVRSRSRSRSSC